jgi:hypothetical protein
MRPELSHVVDVEMFNNTIIYLCHNKLDICLLICLYEFVKQLWQLHIYEYTVLGCRVILNKDFEGMWSWSNLCLAGSTQKS